MTTPTTVDTHSRAIRPSSTDSSIRSGAPVVTLSRRVSALVRHTWVSRPDSECGASGSVHTSRVLTGTTTARQHRASQPSRVAVLRASVLSNRYLVRWRNGLRSCRRSTSTP